MGVRDGDHIVREAKSPGESDSVPTQLLSQSLSLAGQVWTGCHRRLFPILPPPLTFFCSFLLPVLYVDSTRGSFKKNLPVAPVSFVG